MTSDNSDGSQNAESTERPRASGGKRNWTDFSRVYKSVFRTKFWRLTVLQLFVITGLIATLAVVWKSPQAEVTREQKRLRVLNLQLFESVSEGRWENTRDLLEKGADPNLAREIGNPTYDPNAPRESVLNVSIRLGDLTSMKMLLDAGANVDVQLPIGAAEAVFLTTFDGQKKAAMLKLLLERALLHNPRIMDLAIENNQPEVITLLKELGYPFGEREYALAGDLENLKAAETLNPGLILRPVDDYRGCRSLLGIALLRGHQDIADWLLTTGGSVDVRHAHGATAMHLAASGNCDWIMGKLRAAGCDPDATDDNGNTPLNYGIASSCPEAVQALIDTGADLTRQHPQHGSLVDQSAAVYPQSGQTPEAKKILILLLAADVRPQLDHGILLPWIAEQDSEIGKALQDQGLLNPPAPQIDRP